MIPVWLSAIALSNADPQFIYFILVDRYFNGDPSNDIRIDLEDPQAFHGGDLQGITQKLDSIQTLGADTIWLSPIFEMRTEKFMGHGAFHGYWIQHLDGIEPAFGGQAALESLLKETQSREINVIMDMVYNHVSFDSPMRSAHPDWFHPDKTIEDWNDPYQLTHHQVHGLPDFDQTRPPVYKYLFHRSMHWQKLGVDGYRIDAIRHLDNPFLAQITSDLHREVGPQFWLLGEDFQGNPVALADRAKQTGLDALFDFPMYYGMIDSFCKDAPTERMASLLWMDHSYPDSLQLVTFLDNHDLPRIMSACQNDSRRVLEALTFQFSIRGTPMITYGTEALLIGSEEPYNRADMTWTGATPAFEWIRSLYAFRQAHPAIHQPNYGQTVHLEPDLWIYESGSHSERAFIVWNRSESSLNIPSVVPDSEKFVAGIHSNTTLKPVNSRPNQVQPGITVMVFDTVPDTASSPVNIVLKHPSTQNKLAIVGSDPALGGWDPVKAPVFEHTKEGLELHLSLPKYAVLSFKLVQIAEDNSVQWEEGENRYLWLNEARTYTLPKIQIY